MRTFIQLKDNVGFAAVNTSGETEGIEVEFGTGDQYVGKLYSNSEWSIAPLIRYAIVNESGNIVELCQTKYSSEVGSWPEWNSEIPTTWNWINGSWVDPNPIIEVTPTEEI